MSQSHGYPTRSRTSEETTNTDTSTNCNFAEEMPKLRIDLVGNFHDLRDEFINMKNVIIKKLQDENAQLKETIANLQHKVIVLETAANSVEQYDRRNNIEITGIPDDIEDKNLEHSVIEIFKAADIQISHNDVEDCHRIGKPKGNSKKIIVRLVNRKYCKQILYNRRKFKNFDGSKIGMSNTKIFVNENLTNYNHQLAFNCRKLKREKLISKTYSSNGIIHIVQILGNKPIKVFHQSKLDELFPDFNFDGQCGEAPKVAHESV